MTTETPAAILVCDDDTAIVDILCRYLEDAGYRTLKSYTGKQALEVLEDERVDLLLLDIMMPELDGIKATRLIRERWNIPIIMVSAKSEPQDKVLGLNNGADDYITKPFMAAEVVARVQSQLRRYDILGSRPEGQLIWSSGGLVLDDKAKRVTMNDREIKLTGAEYNLLRFLLQHKGEVYSSTRLYEAVWQQPALGSENVINVHIHHLREKIEPNPRNPIFIQVVWGQGYVLRDLDQGLEQ